MAIEQFPNGPTATLNGAIDNVTPTVVITPTAGTWPSGPQYRLLFVNTAELALVTGVSGNTLTCTRGIEGTTAVTHLTAEPLQAVPTGGGLTFAFARIDQNNAGPGNFTSVSATGLYSQVQTASRVVGSVAPGQGTAWTPAGGPYSVGDVVQDISNAIEYVCTVAGTPGTWIAAPSLFLAQTFTAAQTVSLASNPLFINRTDAAAAMSHVQVQRAGATKYAFGLDASDQYALYNAAVNAINLGMTDLGIATLRNALKIPPIASGTVATSGYGSVPVLIDSQTFTNVATVTISSIPGGFKSIRQHLKLRGGKAATIDTLVYRVNGDTGGNYSYQSFQVSGTTTTAAGTDLGTSFGAQLLITATGPANNFSGYVVDIFDYASTADHKPFTFEGFDREATGTGGMRTNSLRGIWLSTAAITSITIAGAGGNLFGVAQTLGEPG